MDRATAPSPAAPRRRGEAARALLRWVPVFGALILGPACALNQQGVDPPADTFFYPASAIADPSASWLFVTNSNADLRYNDGTLVVVDLNAAATDRTRGLGAGAPTWELCPQADYVNPLPRSDPQICCWDRLDANILNCDERRYVQPDATVRIGSFAAGIAWQDTCSGRCDKTSPECANPVPNRGRLLIGVRGDTSLTWVDVLPVAGSHPTFDCGQPKVSLGECGAGNRIIDTTSALVTEISPTPDTSAPLVPVPDEPYALELDPDVGLLYVGHLVGSTATLDTGGVSLFDVSSTTEPLGMSNFLSPFPSPFPPNSAGAYGITALKRHVPLGQPPGQGHEIFASSRYVPSITSMGAFGTLGTCPLVGNDIVAEPAGENLNTGLVGSEMRGVEFIYPPPPYLSTPPPYAPRAYALQRVPPALVGFSIAKNQAGGPSATPTDISETCSSPTFLYQYPPEITDSSAPAPASPSRLFVNCFDTGEIYIFDPAVPTLLTTLQVGRGPAGMVFDSARPVAYVMGFSDNNISVVDLAPGSQTQYHVIQRLGFPSVTPR
jgi:hypothetical protein